MPHRQTLVCPVLSVPSADQHVRGDRIRDKRAVRDLQRMAVARGQLPMRQQAQPQPVQGVGRAALPQEAPGHRQAALRAGRPDRRAGPPAPCRWFPGRAQTRIPGLAPTRGSIRLRGTCAPAGTAGRNRFVRRIAGEGLRRYSLSSARIASEVGPTQAAVSGIHGHPGNSCSGGLGLPRSHSRNRYVSVDSSAGGSQQPGDGASVRTGAQAAPEAAAPPAPSPRCSGRRRLAEASLRPAARWRRIHRRPRWAGSVSPAASSARTA